MHNVTHTDTNNGNITRSISPSMAGVLERLELERPKLVTGDYLETILNDLGVKTPVRIVAARLREKGWLLQTGKSGVWEFAPAAVAGPYSENDPLTLFRAVLLKNPKWRCGLTLQTAAWAHGLADRVPSRIEIAVQASNTNKRGFMGMSTFVFKPVLEYITIRGVPSLQKESIAVHLCERPNAIRAWGSVVEWLPDLAEKLDAEKLMIELDTRASATISRMGYLLQGLRSDLAEMIYDARKPRYKTWFGSHGSLLRHDNRWLIADTLLPFDPRKLESVL